MERPRGESPPPPYSQNPELGFPNNFNERYGLCQGQGQGQGQGLIQGLGQTGAGLDVPSYQQSQEEQQQQNGFSYGSVNPKRSSNSRPPPPDYKSSALFASICCLRYLGRRAMKLNAEAMNAYMQGNTDLAYTLSAAAKKQLTMSYSFGTIFIFLTLFVVVVFLVYRFS